MRDPDDISEEIAQHLEDRYDELRARGLSDTEARRAVSDEAPDRELVNVLRPNLFSGLLGDITFGSRVLVKEWGAALVVVVTLGLAIAANTMVFELTELMLLRALPVANAKRLVTVFGADRRENRNRQRLAEGDVID